MINQHHPIRARRVLPVAAGLAVAVLAWCGSADGATTIRTCSTANVRIELVRTLGAAGSRDWDLSLRNVGQVRCYLRGYPGVAVLDVAARQMNVPVSRRPMPVSTVALGPWQRAYFTFHFESNGPCSSGIFPRGLGVIPPNSYLQLRLYAPFGECAADHPSVTPVRASLGGI